MRYRLLCIAALGAMPWTMSAQDTRCPIDSAAPWAVVSRGWENEKGARWSNDSLRLVLLKLADEDQAIRRDFGSRVRDTAYMRKLMDEDRIRMRQMAAILDRFGLPTRTMVGPAGAKAAFLIVQHNDSLQQRLLAMARTAPPDEVPQSALALLEDRVLVHRGAPQRFGTQFTLGPDGRFSFARTDDLAGLARRRSAAGLPPMEVYLCLMEEAGMRVDRSSVPPIPPPAGSRSTNWPGP